MEGVLENQRELRNSLSGGRMPLTKKGRKVMRSMKKTYGAKKGKQVFYASAQKEKIKGVHR